MSFVAMDYCNDITFQEHVQLVEEQYQVAKDKFTKIRLVLVCPRRLKLE